MNSDNWLQELEQLSKKREEYLNKMSNEIRALEKILSSLTYFAIPFNETWWLFKDERSDRLRLRGDDLEDKPLIEHKAYIREIFYKNLPELTRKLKIQLSGKDEQ